MIFPIKGYEKRYLKPNIASKFIGGIKNQEGGSRHSIFMAHNKAPIYNKSEHAILTKGTGKLRGAKGLHVFETNHLVNSEFYSRLKPLNDSKEDFYQI